MQSIQHLWPPCGARGALGQDVVRQLPFVALHPSPCDLPEMLRVRRQVLAPVAVGGLADTTPPAEILDPAEGIRLSEDRENLGLGKSRGPRQNPLVCPYAGRRHPIPIPDQGERTGAQWSTLGSVGADPKLGPFGVPASWALALSTASGFSMARHGLLASALANS